MGASVARDGTTRGNQVSAEAESEKNFRPNDYVAFHLPSSVNDCHVQVTEMLHAALINGFVTVDLNAGCHSVTRFVIHDQYDFANGA
jgi:hypothetical protein